MRDDLKKIYPGSRCYHFENGASCWMMFLNQGTFKKWWLGLDFQAIYVYLAYSNILHKSTMNLCFSHSPESWGWRNQTKHVIITRHKFFLIKIFKLNHSYTSMQLIGENLINQTPFSCSWVIAHLQSSRSHLPRHFHQGWLLQLQSPVPKPPSRHGFVTCPFFKEDHYLDNSICPATLLSRVCSRVSPLTKMLVSDIISVSSPV